MGGDGGNVCEVTEVEGGGSAADVAPSSSSSSSDNQPNPRSPAHACVSGRGGGGTHSQVILLQPFVFIVF